MSQLKVYSNKFSFYYSLGYFVIVPVKIAIVGVIIFYIFQQIQKKVKNFIDKFNLLENNLRANVNYAGWIETLFISVNILLILQCGKQGKIRPKLY